MSEDRVLVRNLTNYDVIYVDNNGGVQSRVVFKAQQQQPLNREMVERMRYDTGGSYLIKHYLSVQDEEIRQEIGISSEDVEYDYTEEDVLTLLENDDVPGILDALDFGPEGIKDLIVEKAVSLPIKNQDTIKAISEKTGQNIQNKINLIEQLSKETTSQESEASKKAEGAASGRRKPVSTNKKIINGKEVVIPE